MRKRWSTEADTLADEEAMRLGDERGDECRSLDILADTLAEVDAVTLGDTKGDAHALVDTLADTLAEVEAMGLGDAQGDARELVDTLADTLAVVEAVGDKPGYTHALVETLAAVTSLLWPELRLVSA